MGNALFGNSKRVYYDTITKQTKYQPRVVDHSARGSMKNAANCVQTCELQDT